MSDIICDCSRCEGRCCTSLLPISNEEILSIKKYIKQNKIDCHNWNLFNTTNSYVDKCPFLNEQYKCLIYQVRPEICRKFSCKQHVSDFKHNDKTILNLYKEFFPMVWQQIYKMNNIPNVDGINMLYQAKKSISGNK